MDKERYLDCKYLDAGMDGMLCSKSLCTTCKEFNGDKCSDYVPKKELGCKNYNSGKCNSSIGKDICEYGNNSYTCPKITAEKFNEGIKQIKTTQEAVREDESKAGIMTDMLNQEIDSLMKSLKCGSCIHLPLCMAQQGGVNLQLASENNCCYYQPKIDKDSVILTRAEYDKLLDIKSDKILKDIDKVFDEEFEDIKESIIRSIKLKMRPVFKAIETKANKETAEKFVNLPDSDILVVDTKEYGEIEVVSVERLQELAKQFEV